MTVSNVFVKKKDERHDNKIAVTTPIRFSWILDDEKFRRKQKLKKNSETYIS